MGNFREKSVVISLISAIFFTIYYVSVLLGKTKTGDPFPLWWSILGAIFLCYFPVWIVQSGSGKRTTWFAVVVLIVSTAHLLIAFE
jgi:hypothetical protein